jgi:uncharacterized protein (DUF1810 family)
VTEDFDLQRFLDAQEGRYAAAFDEIARGAKRGHWMWYVFPQVAGLGHSDMARVYAIGSIEEAQAYLAHPVLGVRLRACVAALQALPRQPAEAVFGAIDAMKLRSSLTLFAEAGGGPLFEAALARWFGAPDERTLDTLSRASART